MTHGDKVLMMFICAIMFIAGTVACEFSGQALLNQYEKDREEQNRRHAAEIDYLTKRGF